MPTIIELTENQSAEPRCCGSCHFFDRGSRADWVGNCRVSLPPHYYLLLPGASSESGPDTGLADNRSCDLWKPKTIDGQPVRFKKLRFWDAGTAPR